MPQPVHPIQVPADWDDTGLHTFEEFCTLIRIPQRTARDWRQRGIGPRWTRFNGCGRLYINCAVVVNAMAAPSGPWPAMEGADMAIPPQLAAMAHDGFARAIVPSHTSMDGDTIFALATGTNSAAANVDRIGAIAADLTSQAILRAVRAARSIPGYPAASDMR